jgi:hypothetical protein
MLKLNQQYIISVCNKEKREKGSLMIIHWLKIKHVNKNLICNGFFERNFKYIKINKLRYDNFKL